MAKRLYIALVVLVGAVVVYLLVKMRVIGTGTSPLVLVPSPASSPPPPIVSSSPPAPPSTVEQLGQVSEGIATKIGNEILPGAGAVTGAVAGTYVKAIGDIVSGDITPVNVAEVAFFPVAVTATAIDFVADMFGWKGKPLDDVNDIILGPFNPSIVKDNNFQGTATWVQPLYVMDDAGVLHHLVIEPNAAGFSYREIIAVNQAVINARAIGSDITNRNQIRPAQRPLDAQALRNAFGQNIIFKLGSSNDVHTPEEVGYLWWNETFGWLSPQEYGAKFAASSTTRARRFGL